MLRHLQRPTALLLLPLFLLEAIGCSSVTRVQAVPGAPPTPDHIVGITTLDGQDIEFDGNGVIRADTVYATAPAKRPVQVPVDSVQRWWLRRFDPVKSVVMTLGVSAGVLLVAAVIIAATKESCPFVYSWDGSKYVFDAEPYGGAITRGLERDDYGELPNLRPQDGRYRLLVTNEVHETQMTNFFELWAVDHSRDVRVVPDESGGLHTISKPLAPLAVVDQSGRDLTRWLAGDDRLIWEPLPVPDSAGGLRDELILTFPRPAGASRAKLVSRIGTSLWGSHMIRALLQLRGAQVDEWYAQLDGSPAAADSIRDWAVREELYGLQVEVEGPDGWQVVEALGGSGPFLMAERVTMIDLPPATGNSLRLRIRPPRGFWALNSLAVDYSPDQAIRVDTLRLQTAIAAGGEDVLPALAAVDTLYHAMPNTGDRATLEFTAPPPAIDKARTVVLHSRGYYRLHLTPTGQPDTAMVRRVLEEPGAAAAFSASQYREWPMATRRHN
jgi:hypothetical protein